MVESAACPMCGRDVRKVLLRRQKDGDWQLRRCRSCGLHFTFPYPTLDDIKRFYVTGYHDSLLEEGVTEQEFGEKFKQYTQTILQFVPPGRSLDVGCTTGLFPKYLQDAGFHAEGLDVNPKVAAWGRQRYGVPIHVGTLEEFSFSGEPYDLITLTDVVEHTLNPLEAMKQVNRRLRPGCFAMVTFPDIRAVKSRYYQMWSNILRRDLWTTCFVPWHTWEFTEPVARRMFADAGFEIVNFRRTESGDDKPLRPFHRLARPMYPLKRPFLAKRFGTQMEFLLKKVEG